MDKLTIFFDLDDTLYDRRIPYERAFYQFFGGAYTEKLPQAFNAVIHRGYEVFTAAHTGRITMEAMHIYRHQTGLADVGISITPDEALRFQALYAEQQRHITLSDTMRCVLDLCRERFAAGGVITNGSVGSQTGKLKSLGMERWVPAQLVFISDAVGVMKPAPEIFRMAQKAAGGGPCLFVGDSCTQDIAGAAACGWQTIWMNRRGDAGDGGEKSFFGNEKLFFENLLTNSSLCGIILYVNGTNRLLGICVMAAQQTLTLYVGVRLSHPQPMKRAGKSSVYADFRLLIFLMTDLLPGLCKGFSGAFCRQGVVRRVELFI